MDRLAHHLDFGFAVLVPYDGALPLGAQGKSLRAHGLGGSGAAPLLDLLLPVNKAAQYAHLGEFHMAELNARLLKKEVN